MLKNCKILNMISTEKKYNRFSKIYDFIEKPIEKFKFSPLREKVHTFLKGKIPIYSPGIGAQGGNIEATVSSGARYLIVGRAITLANNPGEAAKQFRNSVRTSIQNRIECL